MDAKRHRLEWRPDREAQPFPLCFEAVKIRQIERRYFSFIPSDSHIVFNYSEIGGGSQHQRMTIHVAGISQT